MRLLFRVLLSAVVLITSPLAAASSICRYLLATSVDHPALKKAAQRPALVASLPGAVEKVKACRARVNGLNPDVTQVKNTIANTERQKPRWERVVDFIVPGLNLSSRAVAVASAHQLRRELEREQQTADWQLEDLNREVEGLVFDVLKSRDTYYKLLIEWRDALINFGEASEKILAQIKSDRAVLKQAQADQFSEASSHVSQLAKRTVAKLNGPLHKLFELAIRLDVSPVTKAKWFEWLEFSAGLDVNDLDTVARQLAQLEVTLTQLAESASQSRQQLHHRVRVIVDIVCGHVAQAEKSVRAPSAAP